ncbi:MAG: hypothetical protein ACHREM_04735 [Polyangiales bacterium]
MITIDPRLLWLVAIVYVVPTPVFTWTRSEGWKSRWNIGILGVFVLLALNARRSTRE